MVAWLFDYSSQGVSRVLIVTCRSWDLTSNIVTQKIKAALQLKMDVSTFPRRLSYCKASKWKKNAICNAKIQIDIGRIWTYAAETNRCRWCKSFKSIPLTTLARCLEFDEFLGLFNHIAVIKKTVHNWFIKRVPCVVQARTMPLSDTRLWKPSSFPRERIVDASLFPVLIFEHTNDGLLSRATGPF